MSAVQGSWDAKKGNVSMWNGWKQNGYVLTVKKLLRKLRRKTRVPQALDIWLLFYHRLMVQYGQLRELTIAEDLWLNVKYSYSTCYLASSTKITFKNTLCLLLGIREDQKTITSAVGKFAHTNHFGIHFVSGLGLFQDASEVTHRDWAFLVFFSFILFCWGFFHSIVYNISLMTHDLPDIFPNKSMTAEADLIINRTR